MCLTGRERCPARGYGGLAYDAEVGRREAEVRGRMKRKMLALKRLARSGSTRVVIADGRVEHPIREALAGRGTVIG